MEPTIAREIRTLQKMSVRELREKYGELFDEQPRSHNRQFLFRRIAWRIQALAEGDLTERARRRAAKLANDADLRIRAPKNGNGDATASPDGELTVVDTLYPDLDPRLPMPGTILVREYKGRKIRVRVLPNGFEYEGEPYGSLTAVARKVTKAHWNGFVFFGLSNRKKGGRS